MYRNCYVQADISYLNDNWRPLEINYDHKSSKLLGKLKLNVKVSTRIIRPRLSTITKLDNTIDRIREYYVEEYPKEEHWFWFFFTPTYTKTIDSFLNFPKQRAFFSANLLAFILSPRNIIEKNIILYRFPSLLSWTDKINKPPDRIQSKTTNQRIDK